MNTSPTGIVPPPRSRARVRTDSKPWQRQFWPWFLIALPAISVVFSFATLYIAVSGADEVLPHEGDSSSYSAPEEPGHDSAAAAPGDPDHGVP